MSSSATQPNSASSRSGRLNRGPLLALLAILIVVAVALVALQLLESIVTGLTDLREEVLLTVGLGFAPMALWLLLLIGTLVVRPRLLGMVNIWLAGAVVVMGITGALAFFRPLDGTLAWFSLYGRATLGGQVGDAIIGSPNWLGTLRIFGVFLLAIGVALPVLSADLGRLIAQGCLVAYLSVFMTARSLVSRRPQPDEAGSDPGIASLDTEPVAQTAASRLSPTERLADLRPTGGEAPAYESSLTGLPPYLVSTGAEDSDVRDSGRNDSNQDDSDEDDSDQEEYKPFRFVVEPVAHTVLPNEEDEEDRDADDGPPPFEPDPETVGAGLPESGPENQLASRRANRFWEPGTSAISAVVTENREQPSAPPIAAPMAAMPAAARPAARNGAALLWQRPGTGILKDAPENSISETELRTTAEAITRTLGEYGIEVEVSHVRPGPTVTMYGLQPGWVRRNRIVRPVDADGQPLLDDRGKQITKRVEEKTRVKVDSILAREKDLALALKTPSIRIETPAMGKSLVGIEVPNPSSSLVTLRSVMESPEFQKLRKGSHLPMALGRGSGGEAVSFDLAKMPHLLVAGATGSGKSVCLNAIVSCLVTEKTPAELRLLLVDPKRVELTPYNGLPHLMAPVIVETDTVVGYLKGLIREMFDRYRRMEEVGVRNIEAYNKRMPDRMPFLCVVVDELADLMMTAAFDVEQSLCRLAQLGRATGIHLIIATQRPSVDVVTGLIKANFPSRISFGVTSQVDSRTILDTAGADKLLGRGDMLFLPIDAGKPSRVQNVFIGDQEIEKLVNFWQSTPWPAIQQIDLLGGEDELEAGDQAGDDDIDRDDMMDKAIELALSHRKLSTSLLQRRLRVGYPRAARLMDQLEEEGVVGPSDGSKSRDVIIGQS